MGADDARVRMDNLYREEQFTDLGMASVRMLSPVRPDGSPEETRPAVFIGQAHVLSSAGPLPVQFPIEAASLREALERFPVAMKAGVERMIAEAKEIQRQEASRLIVPGEGTGGIIKPA
ncbi:MAG: hypothetical protein PHN82_07640 [bacterium]|nr:hypothetical protein [bacterium]